MADPRRSSLGTVPASSLVAARLQAHHAAQLVAAFGRGFADALPDDAHSNLGWSPGLSALTSRPAPGSSIAAALRLPDLTLLLVDGERVLQPIACHGRPVGALVQQLRLALELVGLDPHGLDLLVPYFLPDHDVAGGKPFERDALACTELAAWFSLAQRALQPVAEAHERSSDLRCWPHHFDLATLITVRASDDPDEAITVGAGLSPGDEHFDLPYVYVTPWPFPEEAELPALPAGGTWSDEAFSGALLTGEALLAADDPEAAAREFLAAAVPAALRLVGG